MAGIFWLSQQSAPLGAHGSEQASTVAHLTLYAGLAALLSLALAKDGRCELRWLVPSIAFALAVLYGTLDEVHQAFVTGRTASDADLGLDAAGAAIGICLALLPGLRWTIRR
jgi:VanZ family protein